MSDEVKFCSNCDYQGTGLVCPICHEKMISEEGEAEQLEDGEKGEAGSDLLDDDSAEDKISE